MAGQAPTAFGPFLLVERLGAGGMCVVKFVKDELTQDRGTVGRFVDEVRIAIHLQHPHIAAALDVGRIGQRHYLALEYVDGVDVKTILRRTMAAGRPVPPPIAVAIIDDVLAGLAAAHGAVDPTSRRPLGVVHRDVSPHNIIVGFDGSARIIDFGLALSALKQERTEPDVVMGKAAYMAPEQALGSPIDASVDVYASAIVLYELLAARRFYGPLQGSAVFHALVGGGRSPPDLDELGPIADVMRAAWRRPHERPAAADFAARLRAVVPRASASALADWLATSFTDLVGAAGARQERIQNAIQNDDVTETMSRVSLLESAPVAAPDDVVAVYRADGVEGVARVPAAGVVHIVLRGHGDAAAAAWQCQVVDDEVARHHGVVRFFSDVEHLPTHDAAFRREMTGWQERVRGRVIQLVLFRSQLVVVAITIANRLSGGGTEVTSSRARFEAELAAAAARARQSSAAGR
jgi:tRNA A-37 threonylcarbamoyl transferase component Bud32